MPKTTLTYAASSGSIKAMMPSGTERSSETKSRKRVFTREELITEVARMMEVSDPQASVIVETILGSIVRALQRHERVEIRGFGSFDTRQRKARIGRNPKTGAHVDVPPKKVPFFKASKQLRELLKQLHAGETKMPPV